MSRCDKYMEMVSLYIDGELPEGEVPELMEHLAECDDCRKYYEAFSQISGAMQEVPAPEGFTASVMEAVRSEARAKEAPAAKPRRRVRIARYAALAACLALVIAAGVKIASPASNDAAPAEGEPANYNYTAAGDESSPRSESDPGSASVSGMSVNPAGSANDCAENINAVTVSDGETSTRYVDAADIETIVELLRCCGEEPSTSPSGEADYVLTFDSDCGTSELQVRVDGGKAVCELDDGRTWTASGSAEEIEALFG